MKWEEDAYSRRGADGRPVSLVSLFPNLLCLSRLTLEQEEYEQSTSAQKSRFNLSKGDLKLFAITGY